MCMRMRPLRTAARALLGAVFVYTGARAVADPERLVPQAKRVTDRIGPMLEKTSPRLAADTRTMVRVNGAAQLAGGLMMVTGTMPRPAAGLLAGSLVPSTMAAHPFWAADSAQERREEQLQFLKNLGLLGGLVFAAADTGGRPGLWWRAGRAVDRGRRSARRTLRTARREARMVARTARTARHLPG